MTQSYTVGMGNLNERVIFISGTCRSGKTLLSKLLGSTKEIEWIEEPYSMLLIPILVGLDIISQYSFDMIFPAMCREYINDQVLLRNGNFRVNDLSSIWNIKDSKEIFERLVNLNSRSDVNQYILDNEKIFLFDLPEVLPFMDYIRNCCNNAVIIHVIRNGFDVADETLNKGWFSDLSLSNCHQNTLFRRYKDGRCIPWWVRDEEEDIFIAACEYERGLMYWYSILDYAHDSDEGSKENLYDILIRYEDLVKTPNSILELLNQKKKLTITSKTISIMSEFNSKQYSPKSKRVIYNKEIEKKFMEVMRKYGYE